MKNTSAAAKSAATTVRIVSVTIDTLRTDGRNTCFHESVMESFANSNYSDEYVRDVWNIGRCPKCDKVGCLYYGHDGRNATR